MQEPWQEPLSATAITKLWLPQWVSQSLQLVLACFLAGAGAGTPWLVCVPIPSRSTRLPNPLALSGWHSEPHISRAMAVASDSAIWPPSTPSSHCIQVCDTAATAGPGTRGTYTATAHGNIPPALARTHDPCSLALLTHKQTSPVTLSLPTANLCSVRHTPSPITHPPGRIPAPV